MVNEKSGKAKPGSPVTLRRWDEIMPAIKKRLQSAQTLCIVSRTGRGLWSRLGAEFHQILQRKEAQIHWIVVDPENGAVKMIARASEHGLIPGTDQVGKARKRRPRPENKQVFLCYARPDQSRVELIYETLESMGYNPWMDKNIPLAANWVETIRTQIDRSAVFLALLSPQCKEELRGDHWKVEIDHAMEVRKRQRDFIIPVRLEDCKAPEKLDELQWVDWFASDGIQRLKQKIDDVLVERQEAEFKHFVIESKRDDIRSALHYSNAIRLKLPRRRALLISTLDYLPPWALILMDPDTPEMTAFVELASFDQDPVNRPAMMLEPGRHAIWLNFFRTQFELMWKNARPVKN